jgi:hypothetical protein
MTDEQIEAWAREARGVHDTASFGSTEVYEARMRRGWLAVARWAARKAREAEAAMEQRKDDAYHERNKVVAALAKCFPSGVARTAIEGWSDDWHGCVYIDLPTGQVSWHYHDSQAHLFAGLPTYEKPWDGHSTEEKYARLAALRAESAAEEKP